MNKNLTIGLIICSTIVWNANTPSFAKKKSHSSNISRQKMEQQLEESLTRIAFSDQKLESQNAMDFLLDHPKNSYPSLLKLIENEEIEDKKLVNIWRILAYDIQILKKPDISCQSLLSLLEKHHGKYDFAQTILSDKYESCSSYFHPIVQTMITSNDPNIYRLSFNIIRLKQLTDLKQDLIHTLLQTEDSIKKENLLITLTSLYQLSPSPDQSLKPLIFLFRDTNPIIVSKTADLFGTDARYIPQLKSSFKTTDLLTERIGILQAFSEYHDSSLIDFVIPYYNIRALTSNINTFFVRTVKTDQDFLKMIHLLASMKDMANTLSLLQTISSMLPDFLQSSEVSDSLTQQLDDLEKQDKNKTLQMEIRPIQNILTKN